jgi:hypothetical protein
MDVTIRKDKQTGDTYVEYYKVHDKSLFRYSVLKAITKEEPDITIIIDTNHRLSGTQSIDCESFLNQAGITYLMLPTEANKSRYLGIPIDFMRKKKAEERIIIFHIVPEQFTRELFDSCFENYDVGLGIGSKEAFGDYLGYHLLSLDDVLFNKSYFEKSIYDSVLCSLMRSSFDIERFLNV